MTASADEVRVQVRRPDELEHDVGASRGAGLLDELRRIDRRGSQGGDAVAQRCGADGCDDPGSGGVGDLHGRCAHAPVCTVDHEQLAGAKPRLRHDGVVRGDERFRYGRGRQLVEPLGHGRDVELVHEDTVGEPASAHDSEDPVARREPAGGWPAGDHRPCHFDARYVGR